MIVNNFDVVWAVIAPFEAHPPLLINANAMLLFPVAPQSL
jgi:hypothetical protein